MDKITLFQSDANLKDFKKSDRIFLEENLNKIIDKVAFCSTIWSRA